MGRRMHKTGPVSIATWVSQGADWSRSGIRLVVIGLVALSLWLLASFVGQIVLSAQMDRQRDQIQAEITQLEAENAHLATSVTLAESPAYAEQIAREQLGYARKGDVIIESVLPQATPQPVVAAPVTVAAPPVPNWRGWLQAFFPPSGP